MVISVSRTSTTQDSGIETPSVTLIMEEHTKDVSQPDTMIEVILWSTRLVHQKRNVVLVENHEQQNSTK